MPQGTTIRTNFKTGPIIAQAENPQNPAVSHMDSDRRTLAEQWDDRTYGHLPRRSEPNAQPAGSPARHYRQPPRPTAPNMANDRRAQHETTNASPPTTCLIIAIIKSNSAARLCLPAAPDDPGRRPRTPFWGDSAPTGGLSLYVPNRILGFIVLRGSSG